jgi:hypothetical protein
MLASARLQSETSSILMVLFVLLDFLAFAFIQRGSVLLWMHVPQKTGNTSMARRASHDLRLG